MSRVSFLPLLLSLFIFLSFSKKPESDINFFKFRKGFYYTETTKVEGQIEVHYNNNQYFFFRKDARSEKTKITVDQCSGFVVDDDSFQVIHQIDGKLLNTYDTVRSAFAIVVESGPISIYKLFFKVDPILRGSYNTGGLYSTSDVGSLIVLKKQGSPGYFRYLGGIKKDQQTLGPLFSDHPSLVAFGDEMNFEYLRAIVRAYNENRNSW
jgi:hypothetical protein